MKAVVIPLFLVGAFLEVFKVSFRFGRAEWQALLSGTIFALIAVLIWLFS